MEHKELTFKTAIITGVGGFFGSHLCERLLAMGIKVIGVDINEGVKDRFKSPNYSHITATFEDYSQLHTKITEPVDIFFHFAWAGGLLQESFWNFELQLKNAYYGCVAFEEANKIGCKRFVNSGTNNQIATKQNLCSIDFSPRGTEIYSASKTCLELICKTLATRVQTEFIGTMIPMPYGKGNRSMQLFNVVIKNLLEGKSPKLIEGKNLYDIVYVEDVVSALIAVAEKGIGGRTYYIGHRKLKTFRQWIEDIRDIVAPTVILKFGEYQDPLNMDYSYANLDLLYEDTGYELNSDFKETIEETVEWISNNIY